MAPDFSAYAFISLGANLPSAQGDPVATLERAIARLRTLCETPLLLSSFWRSSPVDCPPGSPVYVNAAAALVPREAETPMSLLHELQAIEQDFGRRRTGLRNEPRVLDLDLISFKQASCDSTTLVLPHPRAGERLFVLLPLREITGGSWRIPGHDQTVGELIAGIHDQDIRRLLRDESEH